MDQKSILECKLLAVVIFDQVQRLEVFWIRSNQESDLERFIIMLKTLLQEFNCVSSM